MPLAERLGSAEPRLKNIVLRQRMLPVCSDYDSARRAFMRGERGALSVPISTSEQHAAVVR